MQYKKASIKKVRDGSTPSALSMYKSNERFNKISRHSRSRQKPMIDRPVGRVGVLVSKNGCEYLMSEIGVSGKKVMKIIGKQKAKVWQCKASYGKSACSQTWENSKVRTLTRK